MIEIVASVCLIANAAQCKDVKLTYLAETVSPRACIMNAQFELAKWVGEHPGWQIARWSCGRAGKMAQI